MPPKKEKHESRENDIELLSPNVRRDPENWGNQRKKWKDEVNRQGPCVLIPLLNGDGEQQESEKGGM
jgi:hypothetical protein